MNVSFRWASSSPNSVWLTQFCAVAWDEARAHSRAVNKRRVIGAIGSGKTDDRLASAPSVSASGLRRIVKKNPKQLLIRPEISLGVSDETNPHPLERWQATIHPGWSQVSHFCLFMVSLQRVLLSPGPKPGLFFRQSRIASGASLSLDQSSRPRAHPILAASMSMLSAVAPQGEITAPRATWMIPC